MANELAGLTTGAHRWFLRGTGSLQNQPDHQTTAIRVAEQHMPRVSTRMKLSRVGAPTMVYTSFRHCLDTACARLK